MRKAWHAGRWIALACAFMCASAIAQTGEAEEVTSAQAAAKDWLALVDAGRYGESWDETAAPMKAAITRAGWESTSNSVRKPLGAMGLRNLKSARFTRNLPGAPEGEIRCDPLRQRVRELSRGDRDRGPDARQGWKVARLGLLHPCRGAAGPCERDERRRAAGDPARTRRSREARRRHRDRHSRHAMDSRMPLAK